MEMNDINLWLITNKPDIAKFAIENNVDRIFVDLELIGKKERQGYLNTVISYHTLDDVRNVRKAIPVGKLLVRCNPIHLNTNLEINQIVDMGADVIMLPMWKTLKEVETFINSVSRRAKICLLAETPESLSLLPELCKLDAIDEFHIGLNDLHLALNKKFMFETLADGLIEKTTQCLRDNRKTFGIGGLARIKEGLIPAEIILGEHVRLGSSAAILSRTFHRNAKTLEDLKQEMDFQKEISAIKTLYKSYQKKSMMQLRKNQTVLKNFVKAIVQTSEK